MTFIYHKLFTYTHREEVWRIQVRLIAVLLDQTLSQITVIIQHKHALKFEVME